MSQVTLTIPDSDGSSLLANLNAALLALASQHAGATAPNDGDAPHDWQPWLDNSTNPSAVKVFDGTDWIIMGWFDATNNRFIPALTQTALAAADWGKVPVVHADGDHYDLAGPLNGLRNKIINGDFRVAELGTSVAPGATRSYVTDMWKGGRPSSTTGSTYSRQDAGLAPFRHCMRVQRDNGNSSTNSLEFYQAVETSESMELAGAEATLTFWGRKGADYSGNSDALASRIATGTGSDQSADGVPDTSWTTGAADDQVNTLTASWQRFEHTHTIPSGTTQVGVNFRFTPSGTAGAADYYEITGVDLRIGGVSVPFEIRPLGIEQALCSRHYRVAGRGLIGMARSTTGFDSGLVFDPPMRATPTVALLDTTPTITEIGVGNSSGSGSSLSVNGAAAPQGVSFFIDGFTGLTDQRMTVVAQDDLVSFSARL